MLPEKLRAAASEGQKMKRNTWRLLSVSSTVYHFNLQLAGARHWLRALSLFQHRLFRCLPWDVISCNSVLRFSPWALATTFLEDVLRRQLRLDVRSYGRMLATSRWEAAQKWLETMRMRLLRSNAVCESSVMKVTSWRRALACCLEMTASQVEADFMSKRLGLKAGLKRLIKAVFY